jgi:hypothetical protein
VGRQAKLLAPLLGAILVALPAARASASGSHAAAPAPPRFLPLKSLTAGQRDPRVTPAKIHRTVCVGGYSDTQRLRSSLTKRLRRRSLGPDLDWRWSREGDATTENFWPEPWHRMHRGENVGARTKDGLERYLHRHVCRVGDVGLRRAQSEVATDWYAAWKKYGRPRG